MQDIKIISEKTTEKARAEQVDPFFTLSKGPRRSLNLEVIDTRFYEPQIRARLGTTAYFYKVAGRPILLSTPAGGV